MPKFNGDDQVEVTAIRPLPSNENLSSLNDRMERLSDIINSSSQRDSTETNGSEDSGTDTDTDDTSEFHRQSGDKSTVCSSLKSDCS